eukprot:COSAG05_NODE_1965_length_3772_cov_1256.470188_6_plen_84_part_00
MATFIDVLDRWQINIRTVRNLYRECVDASDFHQLHYPLSPTIDGATNVGLVCQRRVVSTNPVPIGHPSSTINSSMTTVTEFDE